MKIIAEVCMNKMEGKQEQEEISKEILWWLEFLLTNLVATDIKSSQDCQSHCCEYVGVCSSYISLG